MKNEWKWWITGWNGVFLLKWSSCYILFNFGDYVRTTGCQGLYPLHVHGAVEEYEFHQKNGGKTTEMVASSKWLNTINQSNDSNGVCSLQYTVYTVYTITRYPPDFAIHTPMSISCRRPALNSSETGYETMDQADGIFPGVGFVRGK